MLRVNTVAGALAPLTKVQSNLEAVLERRGTAAQEKKTKANDLLASALSDEFERDAAAAILAKLNTLLSPTEG